MDRPLIGIEVDLEANAAGRRYAKCYERYFDAVLAAGGDPVLLPPLPTDAQGRLLDRLDGVVVPGGDDFHASWWGEEQRDCERYAPSDPRRLEAGRSLIDGVLERALPYLGICYGMQLLNVVQGGPLVQDIPEEVEGAVDHRTPHAIAVRADSLLCRLVGAEEIEVNSRHHQSVRSAGAGLVVTARAADGVVEAVEGVAARFLLGVQWHCEELEGAAGGRPLFEGLIAAALERARRPSSLTMEP